MIIVEWNIECSHRMEQVQSLELDRNGLELMLQRGCFALLQV